MKLLALLLIACPVALARITPIRKSADFSINSTAAQLHAEDSTDGSNADSRSDREALHRSICYDELGCFDDSIGETLPAHPAMISPSYHMFANGNDEASMRWDDSPTDLRRRTQRFFDVGERPLIFLAHGWGESLNSSWMLNLKKALLKAYTDANVILIDWRQGARSGQFIDYEQASANVPLIASMTVTLTRKLMFVSPTIKAKNIYFIGFSLGAQLAGFYARSFATLYGRKIGRITSLDAASPNFEYLRIAPHRGDADFVEAIHTATQPVFPVGNIGYFQPYGDIDFYPNGGQSQPGCKGVACSHHRSHEYFIQALENLTGCQFRGLRCASVGQASSGICSGIAVDAYIGQKDIANFRRNSYGYNIVYVRTRATSPFCLN